MLLYFVRHGQTLVNSRGVLHHTADDASLTEEGKTQVKATASWLKTQKPRLKTIYCSTEYRAQETAQILAELLPSSVPFTIQPQSELWERNWGDWSGKTWREVEVVLEDFSLEDRYAFVPPQGESWQQFTDRLQKICLKLIRQTPSDEDIVIVTHGGVMRALMPELLHLPLETSFMIQPSNGEVMTFELVVLPDQDQKIEIIERTDLGFIPSV